MARINIKPLSVNMAFKGRKFKTDRYKNYERDCLLMLKPMDVPKGNLDVTITAGMSSELADIDNVAKPFIDILQKKYGFNDRRIYKLTLIKVLTKKKQEYIEFSVEAL